MANWNTPIFGNGGGGGGAGITGSIATSNTLTTGNNATVSFVHNKNITQADVLSGRYKVVLRGELGSKGKQYGDTRGDAGVWAGGGGLEFLVDHQWSGVAPTNTYTVSHGANSFSILLGGAGSSLLNATLQLIDTDYNEFT